MGLNGKEADIVLGMAGEKILHITTRPDWDAARLAGRYESASLSAEGFIHFSFPEQLARVANANFHGQEGLVVLVVDPDLLEMPLKLEVPEPGAPQFPHLYGPLNVSAVLDVVPFREGPEGFELPSELMGA
jgi:uncharacterized protein (DUF952 family)